MAEEAQGCSCLYRGQEYLGVHRQCEGCGVQPALSSSGLVCASLCAPRWGQEGLSPGPG